MFNMFSWLYHCLLISEIATRWPVRHLKMVKMCPKIVEKLAVIACEVKGSRLPAAETSEPIFAPWICRFERLPGIC